MKRLSSARTRRLRVSERRGPRAGLISDCRVIECMEGDVARLLSLRARHADLVVLGQPDREGMVADGPGLPATVALDCGRPVIVVPTIGTAATIGERVLVAWDGGREAVRAVNDALPILRRAKSVTVLSVNPAESEDDGPREPGADISTWRATASRSRPNAESPRSSPPATSSSTR